MNFKSGPPARPISPDEVGQGAHIPHEVFAVVNRLLQENWSDSVATIKQKHVVHALESHFSRDEIFGRGYLNFEGAYRAQGWKVTYDKPGYNESYDAFWMFKRK